MAAYNNQQLEEHQNMAVAAQNQMAYNYMYQNNYYWPHNADWDNTLNQKVLIPKDDDLSSLIRDTMTSDINTFSDTSYFELEQTELDPDLQDLILQNEPPGSTMNLNIPQDFMIKQEDVDSDNDSVMFEYEDLGFLDNDRYVDSDDSNSPRGGNDRLKFRTTSRSSVDSGYEESNLPRFDCIFNDRKLLISTERDDEEDDIDSKPYCKSNRGAKKNLLWKFILDTLKDKNQKLISWQDEQMGTFKFDDTVAFSKKWGARKGKNDMNFEKLSRAIRHYYKNGLMSRISTERLVYKFNWKSVPIRYRRYSMVSPL